MSSILRLETRRNVTPLFLPILIGLLWISPYGRSLEGLPVWARRSSALQESLLVVLPFVAGAAAWTASRDSRRQTGELLATTARDSWRRGLAAWAATVAWSLLFLAAATGVLYAMTARDATWGGPNWWPVAVSVVAIVAFATYGHVVGTLLAGRFVAPMTAIGAFLLIVIGGILQSSGNQYGLVVPIGQVLDPDRSVFIQTPPDVAIVQLLFLSGTTLLALGLLAALPKHSPTIRRTGIGLTAVGTAAAVTGLWLAGTSQIKPHEASVVVPHLHPAAAQHPVAFTPACDRSPIPVCVHPAYIEGLGGLAAALRPVSEQFAGVPGAPVSFQVRFPVGSSQRQADTTLIMPNGWSASGQVSGHGARELRAFAAAQLVQGEGESGPAQQALALGVQATAGDPMDPLALAVRGDPEPGVTAAAQRFAALDPATRHTWLATHLSQLRAGHLTLADLP